METQPPKLKKDPPFPTSSRPHDATGMKASIFPTIAGEHSPPQPPKKQARRRLAATRPSQERLLSMAEARREIVTALKFHRAAMKHSGDQQNRPPQPMPPNTAVCCRHQSSLFSPFSPLPGSNQLINFNLPNQPLGLNLNFQSFTDIKTPLFRRNNSKDPNFHQPSSSSSSSTSPSAFTYSYSSPTLHSPAAADPPENPISSDQILHPAMGDEEMAEIRSVSEKHGVEWNDTVNSMSTARWSEFLKVMEEVDNGGNREGDAFQMDYCQENYLQLESQMDLALPWQFGGWFL